MPYAAPSQHFAHITANPADTKDGYLFIFQLANTFRSEEHFIPLKTVHKEKSFQKEKTCLIQKEYG